MNANTPPTRQLITAADHSTQVYGGSRVSICPQIVLPESLPNVSVLDFTKHSDAATALATAYSQSDFQDGLIPAHAKEALPIFKPLAQLIEALRAHRSSATVIENTLTNLKSALGAAFKPLINAAISINKEPINNRARVFFERISQLIKQGTRLDFDFLMPFRKHDPDARAFP